MQSPRNCFHLKHCKICVPKFLKGIFRCTLESQALGQSCFYVRGRSRQRQLSELWRCLQGDVHRTQSKTDSQVTANFQHNRKSQIDASFSPFEHPTQVDTTWSQVIRTCVKFTTFRDLREHALLANPFNHHQQVCVVKYSWMSYVNVRWVTCDSGSERLHVHNW